jgi:small subunit ribosomal protein S11
MVENEQVQPEVPAEKPARGPRRSAPAAAIVHIRATFNNTIVSVTDRGGAVIAWASAGSVGFTGAKKGTPFAAQLAAETAAKKSLDAGVKEVSILVKGPGVGREAAIRAIQAAGLEISLIKDMTPIPHNGCRPPKRRRV